MKNILKKALALLAINWCKTIYFNLKMLPVKQAINLPVLFYGPVKFTRLNGRMVFNTSVKMGVCKFGYNQEIIRSRIGCAELRIDGTLVVNGSFSTGNDYIIHVLDNATLSLDYGTYLGSRTKIICTNRVEIGKWFRFGYESQIYDSNYHYTIDLNTGNVGRINGEVIIADYCWVGNRTSIQKGTITPKYLIVSSNSLLNKNYTLIVPEKSLIGGIPAKFIRDNIIRVFEPATEIKINDFFKKNDTKKMVNLNLEILNDDI